MHFLDVRQASFTYVNGHTALNQVDFYVEKGERVAVLGPNGAGKSTLLQLLNGLLRVDSGEVRVDGLRVEPKNLFQIRSKVGMVFQDSDDQLFNSTVRQEIAYGLMNLQIKQEELKERIDWALETVGIAGYADKSPHNLSGGEKKRVALASVLVMNPDVLVLDEPTAALDPHGVFHLVQLLNRINREMGVTLIVSTHDADVVPLLADRVYLMNDGKIQLSGSTQDVFRQKESIRKLGLRLPRVAHLAEILERDGCLPSDRLPLTIGSARELFKEKGCMQADNLPAPAQSVPSAHGKRALVVVSFGTTHRSTLDATISAIEQDLSAAFPEYDLYRAFSSRMVIKRLQDRDGLHIDTIEQVLERLAKQGYETVLCQPTHILNGVENDQLVKILHRYRRRFATLAVGKPLLSGAGDIRCVANFLPAVYPAGEREAVVLVGHGTDHHANAAYAALSYTFHADGNFQYQVGTVEGYPDMETTLRMLQEIRAEKIRLIPFLIVAGDHAMNDINGDGPDSWKTALLAQGYQVEPVNRGLGECGEIRKMFVEHARQAVRDSKLEGGGVIAG